MMFDILSASLPLLILLLMIVLGYLVIWILPPHLRDKLVDWILQDRK